MHCVFSKESLYNISFFTISTSKFSMLSIMMSTCQMFNDFWQNLVISTKEDFHPIPSNIKPLVRHPSQTALYKVTGNIQITICKCNCCIRIPLYVPEFQCLCKCQMNPIFFKYISKSRGNAQIYAFFYF